MGGEGAGRGPTGSKRTILRVALCALSAALMILSCADFDIWPLTWFAMVPWLWVVLDGTDTPKQAFRYGWLVGIIGNGGGFSWINHLLVKFGHMPLVAAIPLWLLLCVYQGLSFGLFSWALRRLRDHSPGIPVTLLAPLVMVAVELVTPFVFPWYLAITQAWVPSVIQIAELTGPLGVTFLLVLCNAALFELATALKDKLTIPWRRIGLAFGFLFLTLIYGQIRIHQIDAKRAAAPHVKVGLVQANIGINEKWSQSLFSDNLLVHQRLSSEMAKAGAQFVVWPESSYPYAVSRTQPTDFHDGRQVKRGFDVPILFGALTRGSDSLFPFNSALMMDSEGRITGRFDKNFLLVFGEYVPYYEHLEWFRRLVPEVSNFARGHDVTTFPLVLGDRTYRLGPMICYEDIIPAFGRRLVGEKPNLLVNITNDAWFGATAEPWEHMALAVFRAVEHRLDLVRAVNTGVSAHIDATGRVRAKSKAVDPDEEPGGAQPAPLLVEVAMLDASGPYGALGDLFGGIVLFIVLGLAVRALAHAGRPLVVKEIVIAAAVVFACALASGLVLGAPLDALSLLARRTSSENVSDKITVALLVAVALGAAAAGVVLARRAVKEVAHRPRLELAVGVLVVVTAPALLIGRTEGNTAAIVFGSLGSIGVALLALRLAWPKPAPEKPTNEPSLDGKPARGSKRASPSRKGK